eukprot:scaffold217140_cov36-Tisochrysis_lutea.AAC.1
MGRAEAQGSWHGRETWSRPWAAGAAAASSTRVPLAFRMRAGGRGSGHGWGGWQGVRGSVPAPSASA